MWSGYEEAQRDCCVHDIYSMRSTEEQFNQLFPILKKDRSNILTDKERILQSTARQNSSEVPSTATACQRNNRGSKKACEILEEFKKYSCKERLSKGRNGLKLHVVR